MRIAKLIAAWILALFLCVTFFRAGITKFDDGSGWSAAFRAWHFPVWFRLAIGALEVLAAALVLWPRTAGYGAGLMAVVMLGAVGTFAVNHRMHPTPIVTLLLAAALLALRYRDAWRLKPALRPSPQQ
jgi:putative oxidoreductase